jgi:hypothetical protein
MGMYLMRQIGRDGNYKSDLPDFMVFLDLKELPWHWALSDSFAATLVLVALVPGLVAVVLYMLAAHISVRRDPSLGPPGERTGWRERLAAMRDIWTVALLFALVLGGLYGGWFTPTEAAGVGAAGGFLVALARGQLDLPALGRVLAKVASRLGGWLTALDRVLTPRRALVVVAAAGIATLIASQFLDFRAAEIGQAAYDPIQDITRAPRIDVQTPIDSHSILLLVVGAAALAGLVGAAATGRRAYGGLIALAGVATIAVTLLIDLPNGLDIEVAELSYSGVVAVLLSGFWAQLAAGFVLAAGGLGLLALSAHRSTARAGQGGAEGSGSGRERGRRGDGRTPIDAGGLT